MRITSSLTKALTPTAVALGNFDGVHRGHQQVIAPVLKTQQEAIPPSPPIPIGDPNPPRSSGGGDRVEVKSLSRLVTYASEHTYATVVTFNPHPQEFFTGKRRTLLTPLQEKAQQLETLGVEQLVLLPFDRELAALSPQEFVEKILVQQLHVQQISVGEDFCFGRQRSGTASDLKAIAATFDIPVTIIPLHYFASVRISSSFIRQALEQGDLPRAQTLLGRPYALTGKVVKGQQLGRTIGFPTANIQLPAEKFLPRQGVYAVRVLIEDESGGGVEEVGGAGEERKEIYQSLLPYAGVMNIGVRPTVNGTQPSLEVHLLDWSGDLYGQTLKVQLEKFLRPEQKFASLEALKAQIQADCDLAQSVLMESIL